MSLKVSDVEARDILKAVEASSTSGDHEVPLLAPVRRALDVTKALLPWMEAIEWEAAGCGDSDCDEDGDESDEENIMERGEQEESELDGAGSVESVNSSGAEAGEEDFISDNEAATALVRLLSPISPTDGEPVNIDNFEQAPLSGFRFVDKLFPAVDGAGMYPLICRMNHSCEPNVKVLFSAQQEMPRTSSRPARASVVALRPIKAGEELCFSYIDSSLPASSRQQLLLDRYGFQCACLRCRVSDTEASNSGNSERAAMIRHHVETIVSTITAPSMVATSVAHARDLLAHAGVVEIPAVVPADLVQRCCRALTTRFEELLHVLHARGLVESKLISAGPSASGESIAEPTDFFRFNEICQRSARRYDLRVDSSAAPFAELLQRLQQYDSSEGCVLGRLAKSVLGRNYKVLYVGVVWSQPGSEGAFIGLCRHDRGPLYMLNHRCYLTHLAGQDWHTDGPHLFSDNSRSLSFGMHDAGSNSEEEEADSDDEDGVPMFAPAHALNIFVPLVDLKPGNFEIRYRGIVSAQVHAPCCWIHMIIYAIFVNVLRLIELGCTQFLRGSHVLATAGVTYGGDPTTSVARARFDVRTLPRCMCLGLLREQVIDKVSHGFYIAGDWHRAMR
eukprot:INCI13458.19.p1 GENE.INCI13458.19~~INCI13458.19.p1  ORF type:complete len:619 (+),score=94.61 INCI13458.19:1695-3551(+)